MVNTAAEIMSAAFPEYLDICPCDKTDNDEGYPNDNTALETTVDPEYLDICQCDKTDNEESYPNDNTAVEAAVDPEYLDICPCDKSGNEGYPNDNTAVEDAVNPEYLDICRCDNEEHYPNVITRKISYKISKVSVVTPLYLELISTSAELCQIQDSKFDSDSKIHSLSGQYQSNDVHNKEILELSGGSNNDCSDVTESVHTVWLTVEFCMRSVITAVVLAIILSVILTAFYFQGK